MKNTKSHPKQKQEAKVFAGKRIVLCGKGGSGKSSLVALMNIVLQERGYETHILDGDASNSGLYYLLGLHKQPKPLVDYFGGVTFSNEPGKVTCPVDDPTPLDREKMELSKIPGEYYAQENGLTFFSMGKITKAYEGCHGPQSKVTRDFILPGNHVTLIDIEAGLEHFGRGIEVNADAVITVVDPNVTSFEAAKSIFEMVREIQDNPLEIIGVTEKVRLKHVWTILNKVDSPLTETVIRQKLRKYGITPIGVVHYDAEIARMCLMGLPQVTCAAKRDVGNIVDYLEAAFVDVF